MVSDTDRNPCSHGASLLERQTGTQISKQSGYQKTLKAVEGKG